MILIKYYNYTSQVTQFEEIRGDDKNELAKEAITNLLSDSNIEDIQIYKCREMSWNIEISTSKLEDDEK